jgi:hypothetical protein
VLWVNCFTSQQLETGIRGEILSDKFNPQITLDPPSQARYAQPHQRGLLCGGSNIGVFSLAIAQEAFLLQIDRCFTQYLFSDQG